MATPTDAANRTGKRASHTATTVISAVRIFFGTRRFTHIHHFGPRLGLPSGIGADASVSPPGHSLILPSPTLLFRLPPTMPPRLDIPFHDSLSIVTSKTSFYTSSKTSVFTSVSSSLDPSTRRPRHSLLFAIIIDARAQTGPGNSPRGNNGVQYQKDVQVRIRKRKMNRGGGNTLSAKSW